jgi:hypothetical protein
VFIVLDVRVVGCCLLKEIRVSSGSPSRNFWTTSSQNTSSGIPMTRCWTPPNAWGWHTIRAWPHQSSCTPRQDLVAVHYKSLSCTSLIMSLMLQDVSPDVQMVQNASGQQSLLGCAIGHPRSLLRPLVQAALRLPDALATMLRREAGGLTELEEAGSMQVHCTCLASIVRPQCRAYGDWQNKDARL